MRTGWNVALQVAAVVVALALRFLAPGWMLVILVFSVVGPVLLLVPPVLSLVVLRWRALPRSVAAPFVTAATSLLLVGLLLPDVADDPPGGTPVLELFGVRAAPDWAWTAGMVLIAAYLASVLWLGIAVGVAARSRPHGSPGAPHGPLLRTEPPEGPAGEKL
ncbi:hypothetical protein [Pseudonocardia xishanensis]|uniref:Uncharacterized protein n=1 Tax=Pseudonocardia xishanensis TaxID=630995 RepID=A0ABP8RIM1_9PSEU